MRLAWIGTGVMGRAMAGHWLAAGHDLTVHTRTREKAGELIAAGAAWAGTPAAAARGAEAVAVMVGYPEEVESAILGPAGALGAMRAGSLLVDFTTSRPALAVRIAAEAAARGVEALDAPVSGGDIGARAARLSMMVGGSAAAFERARPLLALLGKTCVRQGGPGAGQHAKLVKQLLIAGTMLGVCEGLAYARRAGLEPETVLASVGGGAAASWSLQNLYPRMLRGDHAPGFYVKHFLKDLRIALDEAERLGLNLPGAALARQLYERLAAGGGADFGTQALIRLYA